MRIDQAIDAFAALAQESRLRAFRILVEAGPSGLAAGIISDRLGIAHNSLSFHLAHLTKAGLIKPRKDGRKIIYTASFECVRDLIRYMVDNCCETDNVSCHMDATGATEIIEFFTGKECAGK
ncbi:ArsR/SmtB family transcription factor [Sneathiella sp.]|uniref:ArsR/SmtB family transcription factor n=1 Tax=Sneathiella sp. TaxID=1964365 RepID=UPI003567C2B2